MCLDCCLSNEFSDLKKFKPKILCKQPLNGHRKAQEQAGGWAGLACIAGKDVELTFTSIHFSPSIRLPFAIVAIIKERAIRLFYGPVFMSNHHARKN